MGVFKSFIYYLYQNLKIKMWFKNLFSSKESEDNPHPDKIDTSQF